MAILFEYESATAKIKSKADLFWVTDVVAKQRKLGHGTGVMQKVCDYADENGLDLWLNVRPYTSLGPVDIMTMEQLVSFYKRFRFANRSAVMMVRKSRKKQAL